MGGRVQSVDRSEAPEAAADRRADRRALRLIAGMLAASLIVNVTSLRSEAARSGSRVTWPETLLLEVTSHLAILVLAPLVPRLLDRWPIVGGDWRRFVPAHLGGGLAFSLLHVSAMSAARKLFFPLVLGFRYAPNLFAPPHLLYELRKDAFSYALLLVGFVLMRAVEQRRLETETALGMARREHKLTLTSGGTSLVMEAGRVIWAKAAGNYVEIATGEKTVLARITLSDLERLLMAAGSRHLRVHRSYVINLDEVREVTPTGEGDVSVRMSDGTLAPGSRRYRERLSGAMRERAVLASGPGGSAARAVRR